MVGTFNQGQGDILIPKIFANDTTTNIPQCR